MFPTRKKSFIILYGIIACIIIYNASADQVSNSKIEVDNDNEIHLENNLRLRRAIKKPGIFWVIGSNLFQQINETKSAYKQIRDLLNDQFSDNANSARSRVSTTPDPTGSTTQAPFRISRREFNQIIMRNLKGLVRLYNLELEDALKQSNQNQADFNRELKVSIKQELS